MPAGFALDEQKNFSPIRTRRFAQRFLSNFKELLNI
jgi:hypothetical protein